MPKLTPSSIQTALPVMADSMAPITMPNTRPRPTGRAFSMAVLDFVGSDATLATAAACVGRQGMVVLVGLAGGALTYSFMGMPGEAAVMGSTWGTRNELEEVIALAAAGRLSFHVEQHPLADINDVFHRLETGEVAGRAVLVPWVSQP